MISRYFRLAIFLFFAAFTILYSCKQQNEVPHNLQQQIDSLQQQLKNCYKPGMGDFMAALQIHHAKLYFAGQAANWKPATFEMKEIGEAFDGIRQYNTDRPELKSIDMIKPALDSVAQAILLKDGKLFMNCFLNLTKTCNKCHQATNHEFNLIKIPDTPPFSNQIFKVE